MTTIATIPAILALVQLAKDLGVSGKWAAVLAVALGIALNVASTTLTGPAFVAIADGLLLGLAAAGLYDVAKIAAPTLALSTGKARETVLRENPSVTIINPAPAPQPYTITYDSLGNTTTDGSTENGI